jgi:hypothetical protein
MRRLALPRCANADIASRTHNVVTIVLRSQAAAPKAEADKGEDAPAAAAKPKAESSPAKKLPQNNALAQAMLAGQCPFKLQPLRRSL